ncbi:MAG: hypothetical protein IKR73_00285 [Oscillospiraceae bacterium]|nr:hypothetical protein [Oscillospiraceae bacterium]
MNKQIKLLILILIVFLSSLLLGMSVSAESYTFDVSSAKQTNGDWKQSFIEYTPLEGKGENEYHFNPLWMTPQSEVIAEFRYEGEPMNEGSAPIELIWQTWQSNDPRPEGAKDWAKVAPAEYTDTTAVFKYDDIVEAYGTSDFSTVYAINIGDTGTKLKLVGLTVTNIDRSQVPGSPEAAVPQHGTAAKAADIEANAPDEGGSIGIVIGVAAAVVAVVLIVVGVIVFLKKHNEKGY